MAITSDFIKQTLNEQILLRPDDDNWGPFEFDCSNGLPSGVTIADVSATCYTSFGTEEPNLIESDTETVVSDTSVQLYFQVPSGVSAGSYYLMLTLTLSNGGTKKLAFWPINVEAI